MGSTVIEEEIGHFFRGLSKLTLELSPSNYSSLRSRKDHFALGWVERKEQKLVIPIFLGCKMTIA